METHRVITIHPDRMTLSDVDGVFPITSYASTLKDVLGVVAARRAIQQHVELVLAPTALIVCRRCRVQYDERAWAHATYYEFEPAPGVVLEVRRCACGVDLTPKNTLLRHNLTSN